MSDTAGNILAEASTAPDGSTAEVHLLSILNNARSFAGCMTSNIDENLESNLPDYLTSNLCD